MSSRNKDPESNTAELEGMKQLVTSFWHAFDEREFDAALALLHPRFEALWPNTRERFPTGKKFIDANRHYPGRWRIDVERCDRHGDGILTVVQVTSREPPSQMFSAVSFFHFEDDCISRVTEYWGDCVEPPEWRKPYAVRY